MAITKDDILKDLLDFFFDEFENNPVDVGDWLAQGDHDVDLFIEAARKLRETMKLRD